MNFHDADLISLSGSKVSARSQSPGGSIVALSDRLSLASGSLGAGIVQGTPLSPQQLGVMGKQKQFFDSSIHWTTKFRFLFSQFKEWKLWKRSSITGKMH